MKTEPGIIHAIARHGETKRNSGKPVYRGWKEEYDNQLSDKGVSQAEEMGKEIESLVDNPKNFVIVSSDLNRARRSAEIAAIVSGVKIGKAYKELRSMDTGDFTGKPVHVHQETIDNHIQENPDIPLKGGKESYNDFVDRVKLAFEKKLVRDYPGKQIIVVTHHQVEVLHANGFETLGPDNYKKGIPPGGIRLI